MKNQLFPIALTVATFFGLTFLLFLFLHFLNALPLKSDVVLQLHPVDILVGLTIYIKTAIDFALFIGTLMHRHPGVKNRIAIELGTSIGNGIGTLLILTIWVFFKEIPLLLLLMVAVASLVLLRMAEESFVDFLDTDFSITFVKRVAGFLKKVLQTINKLFDPVLGKLLPHASATEKPHKTFASLFFFALTIPFLLGLDDFAGYIPLFNIITVFGFATGVFLGHMLLTAFLFAAPQKTTRFVRLPIILFVGGLVFVGLSAWGLVEVGEMIVKLLH